MELMKTNVKVNLFRHYDRDIDSEKIASLCKDELLIKINDKAYIELDIDSKPAYIKVYSPKIKSIGFIYKNTIRYKIL